MEDQVMRLKRAHIRLMKNKHTALYSGVLMLGESEFRSDIKTACTDGVNKYYNEEFMSGLPDNEFNAVVMHENLHVALKHIPLHRRKFKENAKLSNIAADFVVNDVISDLSAHDSKFIKLPKSALFNPQFHNWSFERVYNFLNSKEGEQFVDRFYGDDAQPLDEHDVDGQMQGDGQGNGQSGDEQDGNKPSAGDRPSNESPLTDKDIADKVDRALREGGLLAGKVGGNMPRSIQELLEPKVDWRDELREWVSEFAVGKDEYTFRKFDRRHIVNDLYMPTTYSDTIGELLICNDTSGSITSELGLFMAELVSITESVTPDNIRVLWWDTMVRGDQKFEPSQYQSLVELAKPKGGGGTEVGCVPKYIKSKNITPQAVIVFTDGYVEDIKSWDVSAPTLWVVVGNDNFQPPAGKKVKLDN